MTPEQMRKRAQEERARAERLLAQAREAAARAEAYEEFAKRLDALGLRSVPKPRNMGTMKSGQKGLNIAKGRTAAHRPPVLQALYDAGLTAYDAAAYLGTTRDVLKQAWAKGEQFRPIRPEWAKRLAEKGVPLDVWPKKR